MLPQPLKATENRNHKAAPVCVGYHVSGADNGQRTMREMYVITHVTWVMRTAPIASSLISPHYCRYRAALALMEEESELGRQQDEAMYQSLEEEKSSTASAGSPNFRKIAIYGRLQSRSTPWGRAASSGSLTDADDLASKVSLRFFALLLSNDPAFDPPTSIAPTLIPRP
jgi:hypothetical protein